MRTVVALLAALLAFAAPAAAQQAESAYTPVSLDAARARLLEKATAGTAALARPDGYIYGVDLGQAMTELAKAGEREAYSRLRDLAASAFIRQDAQDTYTDGFVAWRVKPGETPDASGTAEALRIAEGLVAGAQAFDRVDDARLAGRVLHGYARHAYTEHGVWLVRNYFNFGTRAFSPNSYVVNFDLNLVQRWRTPEGEALAREVRGLLQRVARPNGLMNEIIQPEVVTAIPLPELASFAPDGVHSIVNSCMVLERATFALPGLGRKFLDTVVRAVASAGARQAAEFFVPPYLDGRSGMPLTRSYPADIFVQGCLARLSHALGHAQEAAFRMSYLQQLDSVWGDGRQYDLLYIAEVVHTLRVLENP